MPAADPDSREARPRRDATITLRASVPLREMIDRAAAAVGKTRSEFMLDSARSHAGDVLLDRRLFMLDETRHEAFVWILDRPPQPSDALHALLSHRAPPSDDHDFLASTPADRRWMNGFAATREKRWTDGTVLSLGQRRQIGQ